MPGLPVGESEREVLDASNAAALAGPERSQSPDADVALGTQQSADFSLDPAVIPIYPSQNPESSRNVNREGPKCSLCGGGADGEPPKEILFPDRNPGDDVSNLATPFLEPNSGFKEGAGWLGPLLGPLSETRGVARVWVNRECAIWCPEVSVGGIAPQIAPGMIRCTRLDVILWCGSNSRS